MRTIQFVRELATRGINIDPLDIEVHEDYLYIDTPKGSFTIESTEQFADLYPELSIDPVIDDPIQNYMVPSDISFLGSMEEWERLSIGQLIENAIVLCKEPSTKILQTIALAIIEEWEGIIGTSCHPVEDRDYMFSAL